MVNPKIQEKKIICFFGQSTNSPQRSKSQKRKIIKLVRIKSSKMVSFTSFSQIKEVRPVMKTAQPDLLSEEEIEVEIILYLLHRYILMT